VAGEDTRALVTGALQRLQLVVAEGRNRRFRSGLQHDPAGPAVLLSPHLDDAVLNCWSVVSDQAPVVVVNVFTGAPRAGVLTTWDAICGASESASHMARRVAEDAQALAPRTPVNLGFLDAQYRRARRPPASWRDIDAALRRTVGAASRIYAPLGATHADHALVRAYAAAVQQQRGVPLRLYADVPYVVAFGWPHWVRGVPADERLDVDAEWAAWARAVPELGRAQPPRAVRLDAAQAAAKLAAMRRYRTQFTALDAGELQRLSHLAVHPYEVYWEVPPAPRPRRARRRRPTRTRTA
jgi:hypothetical protein